MSYEGYIEKLIENGRVDTAINIMSQNSSNEKDKVFENNNNEIKRKRRIKIMMGEFDYDN